MTPLRQQFLNDLAVRGLSENTQRSYLQAVVGLVRYYQRSPDLLTAPEVQQYLLHLRQDRGLSWGSCNTVSYGLRFFYRITLGWPEPHFYIPCAKEPSKLPEVLSHEEVVRLLTVTTNRKHRALLMTTYGAGLRVSEVTQLKASAIDSQRMCLRINQGKGQKDRYVPLSERLLEELRHYWRRERPPEWLFPGLRSDWAMNRSTAGRIYDQAKAKAGITKAGGIHTLRHSWATHLLEAGTDLLLIQRWLGHSSIRATLRYVHIAQDQTAATSSPLDLLAFPKPPRR